MYRSKSNDGLSQFTLLVSVTYVHEQCCRKCHCCLIWRHIPTHCRPALYPTKSAEASLDLAARWGCGVIKATPRPLCPREQHWYSSIGHQAGWVWREENLFPCWDLNHEHSSALRVAVCTRTSRYVCIYIEVKAILLQAWTDPEGSRRLRLPDFKTIGTGRW